MLSQYWFALLVLLVTVQRLAELRLSKRNERLLRRAGALEHAPGQLLAMQLVHGLWLAAMLVEVKLLQPQPKPWLSVVAAAAFVAGQVLRYLAIRALGVRWCVRILTLPATPPVASGVYRYLRHPNYLGVVLEIAALPLVHFAWRTAVVFSLANALLLVFRIAAEERALVGSGGYRDPLAGRPRIWPSFRARGSS